MSAFKEIRAWQCTVCGDVFEDVEQAEGCADMEPECPWHELHGQLELKPVHFRLLRRGVNNRWIGLSDDMGIRMIQVAALGELERAGFVGPTKEELPPGPPSMRPRVITEAGREALKKCEQELE